VAWSNMLEYFAGLALKHLYYGPVPLSIEFMAVNSWLMPHEAQGIPLRG